MLKARPIYLLLEINHAKQTEHIRVIQPPGARGDSRGIHVRRPAFAQKQPPANAIPLSKIIQTIEQQGELTYFDEIEWDSDGYWEVEYYAKDGSKRKVKVDPVSGEVRR